MYSHRVLAADLQMPDLDPRHWRHWWQMLVPPGLTGQPRWALGVVEGSPPRLIKIVVAGTGAVPVDSAPLTGLDSRGLAAWCRALGVDGAVVIDSGVIAAVSAEAERHLSIDQDITAQGLTLLRALKRHAGKGVWTEPHLLDLVPVPPEGAVQRTFDLLVPDNTSLVAYIVDDDRRSIHASIIGVKRGGDIAVASTHRAIAGVVAEGAFARDWPTQYKRVLAAVEDRFAKPSIGVFLERDTFFKILTGPGDQLARELNARRLIIDPAPAWLLGLLGGATVAAIASRGAKALASFLPQSTRDRATGLAQRAQSAMKESGAHPFALLGFDPIELWASVKHFYRQ
jgi:hypothetical protein